MYGSSAKGKCFACVIAIFVVLSTDSIHAQDETIATVTAYWTGGVDDLSPAEEAFFRKLAEDRVGEPAHRNAGNGPGATSEIVRDPILYDLVKATGADYNKLDANIKALVSQAGESFLYFETGVTIDKGRYENIDAMIFELRYAPDNSVSTYSQTPDQTSRVVLSIGAQTELGLTADLKVQPVALQVGVASAEAEIHAEGGLSLALERKFDITETLIAAVGVSQPWARWSIDSAGMIKDDVRFITVLRVPANTRKFSISAHVTFIDKFLGFFEQSRQEKQQTYTCTIKPLRCTGAA